MDKKVEFNQMELQVLYSACMSYGNTLSDVMKKIVGCDEAVDILGDIEKESWNIARKIAEYMEE